MSVLDRFKSITCFIFDVDGVLTDGTVLVLDGGLQARRMHIKDGFALQMAKQNGYRVKIISGGHSPEVKDRLDKLGIHDVSMSVMDKGKYLQDFISTNEIDPNEVLYMGDDLPDIPAMLVAGLPCCPADAASEVKEAAHYISPLNGGFACVRDVIEKVLRLNGHWNYTVEIASK
jgi:3-deoxy-D-manno-octulosonate 8-phosphate phosphatase (KDO 8-P phosphatase)